MSLVPSTPQQNLIPNGDVGLAALLDLERKRTKLEINCHAIATVQAFDPATQLATVTLAYGKVYNVFTSTTQVTPRLVPYPTLVNAPVLVLGGGGASGGALTFPVSKGDECLVAFNDRDIDNWFSGSTGGTPATPRLHAFSDALIIVGFRSLANVLPSYDSANIALRNFAGTVSVGIQIATSLALIQTAAGGTLGTQLQTLLATLSTFATAGEAASAALAAASTGPLAPLAAGHTALAAAFTALVSGVATSATGIAEVLA